jgi:peptidoglycan/xylan/chitin deacetylase (PgdA/CDA1 family)
MPAAFTMSQTPLTICYHAVSETWRRPLALPQARLLDQVRLFRRLGFRSSSAHEAVSGRGRLLHVTFDDAYAGILPTLRELNREGIRHSVFVCSGLADDGGAMLQIRELREEPEHELRTLAWDELRGIAAEGTEVYSHTVSHPHLATLGDAELATELLESRQRLEDELGRPCPFLAYPFGEHNPRVRDAARNAGYAAAFALGRTGRSGDAFAVPRVGIYHRDTLPRAFAKSTQLVRRQFYSGRG